MEDERAVPNSAALFLGQRSIGALRCIVYNTPWIRKWNLIGGHRFIDGDPQFTLDIFDPEYFRTPKHDGDFDGGFTKTRDADRRLRRFADGGMFQHHFLK